MTRPHLILIATLALTACEKENPSTSDISSDDLAVDQRIILKEGHSVILIPENNRDLMVGVTGVDGKLSVSEIHGMGKSLTATWNDEESWTSSVMDLSENHSIIILDENGDGLPDFLAERTEDSLLRYKLETPVRIPIEPNQHSK